MLNLKPVISVKEELCLGCHRCLAVCPVKFCNDGSSGTVKIDPQLCLGCGTCVLTCPHGAREGIDDFPTFFQDLRAGVEMVAIVAPAVGCSFDGKFEHLLGFLKSLGVKAFFDVSFGAELTIRSYIEYLQGSNPKCLIAQPCPALVTYIEVYRPELLRYLAPIDSPMVHTMKMIREYFPNYRHHRLAVLSPCYAKRHEFDAVGLGDYNVTFRSLEKFLEENSIDLEAYPPAGFEGPHAERGVLFSSPGGLLRTLEREVPNAWSLGRKIEGPKVYPYLDHLSQILVSGLNPPHLVIDCLNCELGCNGGAGTRNHSKPIPLLEGLIEDRAKRNTKKISPKQIRQRITTYWRADLYRRDYVDRSKVLRSKIKYLSPMKLQNIYRRMHKSTSADVLNCGSCGYQSCEDMALAIFNGLNRPENCRHYMEMEISSLNQSYRAKVALAIENFARKSLDKLRESLAPLEKLHKVCFELQAFMQESSRSIIAMVENFQKISSSVEETLKASNQLVMAARENERNIQEISEFIRMINKRSLSIMQASGVIEEISQKTTLLGINAAIEAAHVGNFGRGFAVVAHEIKNLADHVANQATSISSNLHDVLHLIEKTTQESIKTNASFQLVQQRIQEMIAKQETIQNVVMEQNAGSHQILERLQTIKHSIETILSVGSLIESMNQHLMESIASLAQEQIQPAERENPGVNPEL